MVRARYGSGLLHGIAKIELECLHIVLDSSRQLFSGNSATCFNPIEEHVPELLPLKSSDIAPTGTLACHGVLNRRTTN